MKKPPYSSSFSVAISAIDMAILLLTYQIAESIFPAGLPSTGPDLITFHVISGLGWLLISQAGELNLPASNRSVHVILKAMLGASLLYLPALLVLFFTVLKLEISSLRGIMAFCILLVLLIFCARIGLMKLYGLYRGMKGHRKNYLIVGFNQRGIRLWDYFNKKTEFGYNFFGYLDDSEVHPMVIGKIADLPIILEYKHIDEIYFALRPSDPALTQLANISDRQYIRLHLISDVTGLEREKIDFKMLDDIRMPVIFSLGVPPGCLFNYRLRQLASRFISDLQKALGRAHNTYIEV
jgi:FlaA1/EpsC-like NDP-sugar epimerase